jgi:tryptophanyl-tRNA synthetase
VTKKIRSAVTDSGRDVRYDRAEKPGIANLLDVLSATTGRSIPELEEEYGSAGYGSFKSAVAEAVVECLSPVRERYEELLADPHQTREVLKAGAERARSLAAPVMARVRRRTTGRARQLRGLHSPSRSSQWQGKSGKNRAACGGRS